MPEEIASGERDKDEQTRLSRRDIQFIGELQLGRTDREIAGRLGLSVKEVKAHITAICDKLGVRNRTELINKWKHLSDVESKAKGG